MSPTRLPSLALVLVAIIACGAAFAARVQPERKEATGPLAEHPAAKMVGLWRGTISRIGRDGAWHEGQGVERARWNLAGTAILVEGYGYNDDPATGERTVGHDAFGLVEYDKAAEKVRIHARRAGAGFESHTLDADPETGEMRWSPTAPEGMSIRFIVNITADRWHEIGEMSRDNGQTWSKFLEVKLNRVDEGKK